MYCTNCGTMAENGAQFCPNCGAVLVAQVAQQPQQMPQQQYYAQQQPYYQQPINYASYAQEKMGWFKFLIYFSLFAGALVNIVNGIKMMSGTVYGADSAFIYAVFLGLRYIDIAMGICLLALAGLQIIARFRLSGYYKNGPKMLYITYIAAAVINAFQMIALYAMIGGEVVNTASVITSIVVSIVMVLINVAYFKKRQYLFVN